MKALRLLSSVIALSIFFFLTRGYAQSKITSPIQQSTEQKYKMIHFSIRNDGIQTLHLRADDRLIGLEKGDSLDLKLAAGSQLLFAATEGGHKAGNTLVVVSDAINGSTVVSHEIAH
ncbi:hypothetical protein [Edaphobacter modestus]|uniref:Uncharacterized protein n=1 Tax=Edaphobacter modestus TaxID=388466 RepID=A0A4Q7YNE5_9BACT|nr:hypothetical protein [Edaphobacter modestus]RZU39147.1 hypothetical protein BDD14_0487 [Edaphobacter modestus]